jgi:hypothetical protein
MLHIPLPVPLPGITGLLEYCTNTALPIQELTQMLLRGESTPFQATCKSIATVVWRGAGCRFSLTPIPVPQICCRVKRPKNGISGCQSTQEPGDRPGHQGR